LPRVAPRPLPGDGTHPYRFHLYALDTDVDFTKVADVGQLRSALKGHVLGSGKLTGTGTSLDRPAMEALLLTIPLGYN
jgi:phosphatidylethanolamine-binding protein (PEBP) family uncharacterized protein